MIITRSQLYVHVAANGTCYGKYGILKAFIWLLIYTVNPSCVCIVYSVYAVCALFTVCTLSVHCLQCVPCPGPFYNVYPLY